MINAFPASRSISEAITVKVCLRRFYHQDNFSHQRMFCVLTRKRFSFRYCMIEQSIYWANLLQFSVRHNLPSNNQRMVSLISLRDYQIAGESVINVQARSIIGTYSNPPFSLAMYTSFCGALQDYVRIEFFTFIQRHVFGVNKIVGLLPTTL